LITLGLFPTVHRRHLLKPATNQTSDITPHHQYVCCGPAQASGKRPAKTCRRQQPQTWRNAAHKQQLLYSGDNWQLLWQRKHDHDCIRRRVVLVLTLLMIIYEKKPAVGTVLTSGAGLTRIS
jgi:hypothetical protein